MMKKFLVLLSLSLSLISHNAQAQSSVKIAALVNGEIISNQDIQNRINSFLMTSQIPLNAQTKGMIVQKVIHSAVDEKIKLQAAEKAGINITEKDINTAIANFEKSNKIPNGELKNILKQAKVSEKSFREQMKADLAWVRFLKSKLQLEGNITQSEIENALAEAKKDLNTPKYQISEIFVKKAKAKDIQDLVENLRKDPRFELYAMKFSDSPSAAKGGNLGWVNQGKLPEKFTYKGKEYTPESFAESLDIDTDDYIPLTSFTHKPYYKAFEVEITDNWEHQRMYNLPLDELISTMNTALENGYTLCWDGDVSEPAYDFNYLRIALNADVDLKALKGNLKERIVETPVTQESRQSRWLVQE